jgi:DNA repair protein RecO (recombination protein O)
VIRKYSSEGIVLARRNYSEADRILVIFTKHFGKISLLAKGIRKPKSRKRGHLEIFSRIKFSSSRGNSIDIMTEVEVVDSYPTIRKSLRKVSLAYYFVEVINKVVREQEENSDLYKFLIEFLERLGADENLRDLRAEFVKRLLVLIGFWPKDRPLPDYDSVLEKVLERKISSAKIGKKILS